MPTDTYIFEYIFDIDTYSNSYDTSFLRSYGPYLNSIQIFNLN